MPELVARLTPLTKPQVPELFKQIIRNHSEKATIHETMMDVGIADGKAGWRRLNELRKEMIEYRRGAEKALKWNTDKGGTA